MESISRAESVGQQRLEKELGRIKKSLNRGFDLKVKWVPRKNGNLSGEVKDENILIYDEDIETALETLKHEFVDHAVGEVIEPYMQVTNKLVALLNERAYQQKERLVKGLVKLLDH